MAKPMLAYNPVMQFFNNDGTVLNGGKLCIYSPGTTTNLNTYPTAADAVAGTNPNENPIILDSSGKPEVDIYVTQSYKMVVKTSANVEIDTVDNIVTLGQLNTVSAKSSSYPITAVDRDAVINMDCSGGARTVTLIAAATAGNGFRIMVKKADTSSNNLTIQANGAETIDGSNTFIIAQSYGYISLFSDGTQWLKEVPANQIFYRSFTIAFSELSSAASKILIDSAGSQRFKIRDIFLSGTGTNYSGGGGNRNISITDNTSTWTILPAATIQSLTSSRWGVSTPVPLPVTGSHIDTASAAGTDIVAKYSGGTTDYTAGSLTVIIAFEQVA